MHTSAFLFDLNGTMINDMDFHIRAWHRILNDLGANIGMEEVKRECYGKNGELLERIFPGRYSEEEKDTMSYAKEAAYQQEFKPMLKLIDGLDSFLEQAGQHKIQMAIGSAAIMYNIDFVLDGLNIRRYFSTIVSAESVKESKPHPETYLLCAEQLGAGMRCVVINTMHTEDEFTSYQNIECFIDDYHDKQLLKLFEKP